MTYRTWKTRFTGSRFAPISGLIIGFHEAAEKSASETWLWVGWPLGRGSNLYSNVDMSSAKKAGINGPCSRPDHCDGHAQTCQYDCNPWITEVSHCDPQFDCSDQTAHDRCPEANEEKYSCTGTNGL